MARKEKFLLPLESNPDVMAKYSVTLGGPEKLYVVDVLGLEEWAVQMVPTPVYSILLLYPQDKFPLEKLTKDATSLSAEGVWFMKQTVGNACGTVGMMHGLINARHCAPLKEGGFLDKFVKKTADMDPLARGKTLEEESAVIDAHREAEQEGQSRVPSASDEVEHHFVSFVHINGFLYVLDGRKENPLRLCPSSDETFLADAVSCIKKIVDGCENIQMSLVALTGSPAE